jgi:hypothetical protein
MIRKGNVGVIENDPGIEWNSGTGFRSTRKFRGLKADILGLIPSMRQAGYTFRITPDEDWPMSECVMTAPDAQDGASADADTEITTIWTVAGNDIEKDLESHPRWIDLAVSTRENLRDFKNGSKKEGEVVVAAADLVSSDAADFHDLIKAGTTSYTISQIVVQRTMTVAPSYAGLDAMTNVNRIYSKAGLTTAESIPTTIVFSLLAGQYLKRTPTITQQPNGRYQITSEWWHADTWATLLYGDVIE